MTTKHTPGPWHVHCHTCNSVDEITPGCDWTIASSDGKAIAFEGQLNANAAADARLLAAAPDLLAAVQAMIDWDDREKDHAVDFNTRMDLCRVAFDRARAAIAKATGPDFARAKAHYTALAREIAERTGEEVLPEHR